MKRVSFILITLIILTACGCVRRSEVSSEILSYRQIIEELADDHTVFSLIFLDQDDIPELAVYDQYYENLSIYTIKDHMVSCMLESLHAVEITYYEKTGVLAEFSRWNGGGEEGGYGLCYYKVHKDQTLTNESIPLLYDTYDAVYNEQGEFTGEGDTHYYQNGKEVDQSHYQEELKNLGVHEHGVSCMEKAMQKHEIIKLLQEESGMQRISKDLI